MKPGRQRTAEWRARRKVGVMIVRITVDQSEIEALVAAGWLAAHECDQEEAVARAVQELLAGLPKLPEV
jgi:hypothetical protein